VDETGRLARRLARIVTDGHVPARGELVEQLGTLCVEVLPVDGAGVSVSDGSNRRTTVSVSDEVAAYIEEIQYTLGEGPCVEAFSAGAPVLVTDLDRDTSTRWPMFSTEMRGRGVGAVFAFPLQIGAIRVGVLDLYRSAPVALNNSALAEALRTADTLALIVVDLLSPGGVDGGLPWDIESHRIEVYQATGMVMAQLNTSVDDAFVRLRAFAFAHGRRLSEVAADVIDRRLRFDEDTR
jgi:hypothetical protein